MDKISLPQSFLERLGKQYPKDFNNIIKTFHQRPPVIRVNNMQTDSDAIKKIFNESGIQLDTVILLPDSFIIKNADRKKLTSMPAYTEGLFYIQSIASQLVVKALNPQPGEKILDLCAAPGSKTSQIATQMNCTGELIANEPNTGRFFKMLANLKSQKIDHWVTSKKYPGQNYPKFFPEYFDKVLVDAPCSSEARFIEEDPKTYRYWSIHKTKALSRLQKKLLSSAIKCLKPGGVVVYSTCTFSPEENELVIQDVIKKFPEIKLEKTGWKIKRLPITKEWNGKLIHNEISNSLRLYPDETMESFFMSILRKSK